MSKRVISIIAVSFLFSCAHHRDVRPGASGEHSVIFQTESESEGGRKALSQANHFCEKRGKAAAVVSENHKYVGSMDEETYRMGKTASKVATGLGGMAAVFGGKKERKAGAVAGAGGVVADNVMGEGYQYTMKFKCM